MGFSFMLAITGTGLLPVGCAFSLVGIPLGSCICVAVALANDFTCQMLLSAAVKTESRSFEEVIAKTFGQNSWVLGLSRVALTLLMFGTCCGNLAAIREALYDAACSLDWDMLGSFNAAPATAVLAIVFLLPMSACTMQELSYAGAVASLFILSLLAWVCSEAGAVSFHNYASTKDVTHNVDSAASFANAASVLGFSFYLGPFVVPALDMHLVRPSCDGGDHPELAQLTQARESAETVHSVVSQGLHICFAAATVVYILLGGGAVAWLGQGTPGNILSAIHGPAGGIYNLLCCAYLGLCLPPILIPLRQSLLPLLRPLHAMWCLPSTAPEGVPEEKEALKGPVASIWISLGILVLAFVVILPLPNASATLFGITSATGVTLTCYLFPVWVCWRLLGTQPEHPDCDMGLLVPESATHGRVAVCSGSDWAVEVLLPSIVLLMGCGVSVLSFISISAQLMHGSLLCG